MVKLVIGDEVRFKSAEDRLFQSALHAQVGIVVGKLSTSSDRGLVYDLIPTPPAEAGAPACSLRSEGGGGRDDRKKGSKGGGKAPAEAPPSLAIDVDWVAEHARQVSRMLLGGMNVIGAYVWASEASFKATPSAMLSQTIREIAQAAALHDGSCDERLLIHISYSPRRWAVRNCVLASGILQPCDFKLGKLLSSLQTFRCTYSFDIRLPIFLRTASSSSTFKSVLRNGITSHVKDIHSARALIDGDLVDENQHSTSEGPHKVELLLPFMKDATIEACRSEEVAGVIVLSGTICASAYLGTKEPISQVISDLKGDIIHSLRSRLDIMLDEGDDGEVDLTVSSEGGVLAEKPIHLLNLHKLREPYHLQFPRRVLIPWLDGVFICDYLQQTETFEDLKDHCKEMMSMEAPIDTSAISEPETEVAPVTVKSFWDVIHGASEPLNRSVDKKHLNTTEDSGKSKSFFRLLSALFALVLALLFGWAVTLFGPVKVMT